MNTPKTTGRTSTSKKTSRSISKNNSRKKEHEGFETLEDLEYDAFKTDDSIQYEYQLKANNTFDFGSKEDKENGEDLELGNKNEKTKANPI